MFEKYDVSVHIALVIFPKDLRTADIRKKTKELKVVGHISSKYDDFYHDKPLFVGGCDCTQRRRIDFIDNTFCIEIDENQHKFIIRKTRFDTTIYMGFSGKFIFIRYNPDPKRK